MERTNREGIHPTAIISPEANLADDVVIGPYVVLEGHVVIGKGSVLRPQVHLVGPVMIGSDCTIYTGAVIGERPQHTRFTDPTSGVVIGNRNVIREHVTIHSGMTPNHPTTIGDNNFFMAHSHIAHDCQIGDNCIFANGALVAGHCTIEDNVYLSGNCAIHQHVRIGRLALLSGCSTTTKDIPCFVMQSGINNVVNLNVVGLRRAGMAPSEIDALRRVFNIVFHEGLPTTAAIEKATKLHGQVEPVREMLDFIRQSERGINPIRERGRAA